MYDSGVLVSKAFLTPHSIFITRKGSVQVGGRADQREMCKRLGEVPEMPTVGTQFFRVQSKVVRVPQQLLKKQLCFFQFAGPRETLHVPK